MTDLNAPDHPGDLYEARGEVPPASPMMQGDVFDHVSVPGLSEQPLTVAIVMHPCSMRAGAQLRPKITVAAVRPYQRLSDNDWRTGHVNVMPLPHLRNTDDWYAIDFREIATVPNVALSWRARIVACSRQGILFLQQRCSFHLTRLAVPLSNLHEVSLPIFTESELLTDWVEAALDATPGGDEDATINEADRRSTPTSMKTTGAGAHGFSNRICTRTCGASAAARSPADTPLRRVIVPNGGCRTGRCLEATSRSDRSPSSKVT